MKAAVVFKHRTMHVFSRLPMPRCTLKHEEHSQRNMKSKNTPGNFPVDIFLFWFPCWSLPSTTNLTGSSSRGHLRRVVHACWPPKNWGSTVQALPGSVSAQHSGLAFLCTADARRFHGYLE
ncbi:unnamed protein product [Polarella glacialis]|uniref:Uncharacterized protein n=1 Tax=Polarella glacialis TaxID=89957 RepID=A0A813FJG1_POLGL|nr:unnamed protein product [Polarella glacialis]